ncbi:MAG TPA: hypothetical protein VGR57_11385, partial [Ktedonobacterales bacterium]|nr:hypothetical protein [Ktedonobacterales bacterium]
VTTAPTWVTSAPCAILSGAPALAESQRGERRLPAMARVAAALVVVAQVNPLRRRIRAAIAQRSVAA